MKTRLIGSALAVALLAAALAPLGLVGSAEAKSVQCDEAGNCKVYCSQTLPNGSFIEYEEGTKITATDKDGRQVTFVCKNGQWVQTAALQIPQWSRLKILGNIAVATIGGIQGTVAEVQCPEFDSGPCTTGTPIVVAPPGLAAAP